MECYNHSCIENSFCKDCDKATGCPGYLTAEKANCREDYCISFIPVTNCTPDIVNCKQILTNLTLSQAQELNALFYDVNFNEDAPIKLVIEKFNKK